MVYKSLKELIEERFPKDAKITKALFEGPNIVVYTKNKDFFVNGGEKIKDIVSELRKRIVIRADPSLWTEPEKAKKIIKDIVPKEAEIKKIEFEPEFSKVLIYARKPGIVIGKNGETLKKIKEMTGWSPEILRMPIYSSEIVEKAREILHEEAKYRVKFLNEIGEKIKFKKGAKEGWVRVSFLGSAREVGRSCILLQTKESRVLLDCGESMSPGPNPHPFLDAPEFDMDCLDAVVLTHAHLDHSGFIPFLYEYGYRGPLYLTAPTRDLMILLQLDYIDIMQKEIGEAPYSSKGIKNAIKHSIALEYGEVCDITPDMRLTFQNAGHILGSAMAHIHVGEGFYNILYTGDIKYGRSYLFEPAYTNFQRTETVIMESTYGGKSDIMPPLKEAQENLINVIKKTIERKGKVIIPSFAVGRSQEIMMVLADRYRKKEIDVPVYLDGMIWESTIIHTTYPEFLSRYLQKLIFREDKNPFTNEIFHKVNNASERANIIDDSEPAIIITTSGMINGGPVMEYLKHLAPDEKNTLIFVGYQAEGTLGAKIQKGWREIPFPGESGENKVLPINMEIVTVEGFSGHSDRNQLINFISRLKSRPHKIMLNHGEPNKSLNLAATLHRIHKVETIVPNNLDAYRLR